MGMLSGALLQGAGQGLNMLAQGMQKNLDREDEQAMWEKRTRMLAEIQRENSAVERKAVAAHEDERFPTRVRQEGEWTAARGKAEEGVALSRASNQPLNDAERKKRVDDAVAATQLEIDATVKKSKDADYLKAIGTVRRADPEVQARLDVAKANIAQSYAAAGNSNAHAASARVAADQAKRVGALFDEASKVLNDKTLTDEQRTSKYNGIVGQIELFDPKGRRKAGSERDPEIDRVKIVEEEMLPGGGTRKTERTEIRRPGNGSDTSKPMPEPPPGAMGMLRKDPSLAAAFDAKYGRGAADQVLAQQKTGGKEDPSGARRPPPEKLLQTTKHQDGSTLYRYKGQDQWFRSQVDALIALGAPKQTADGEFGLSQF